MDVEYLLLLDRKHCLLPAFMGLMIVVLSDDSHPGVVLAGFVELGCCPCLACLSPIHQEDKFLVHAAFQSFRMINCMYPSKKLHHLGDKSILKY